ncbi:MAG: nucleotidyltransferase family protein [Lachnospiraceae bacterium]|nr:nucleotidyltransferase family protein [Lachnospiraceae bacterium]MBR0154407.1 nucleotidyltransferase family protein [Lachnospiraceae bacterium]
MKTAGIIAEFNPFHNGHAYLIQQAVHRADAGAVVVIMSGEFVQRGAPAVMNQYLRAECALLSGADLILQLPVCYATSSADYFASGAVRSLAASGLVDTLVFGCETEQPDLLVRAASLTEDEGFQASLYRGLSEGRNYPAAYFAAISEHLPADEQEALRPLFDAPNNLLAMAYLRQIRELGQPFDFCAVTRAGDAYHQPVPTGSRYPSATALRTMLESGQSEQAFLGMPEPVRALMREHYRQDYPVFGSDLSGPLSWPLLTVSAEALAAIPGIGSDLAARIVNLRDSYNGFDAFVRSLKTRQVTQTRIQRALIHLLLDVREIPERPPYLRVLGVRGNTGRELLSALHKNSTLPVVTSLNEARQRFAASGDDAALRLLDCEINAGTLARYLVRERYGTVLPNEYQRGMLML